MLERISSRLADFLIKNEVIADSDREFYLYCMSATLEMIFSVTVTLLTGLLSARLLKTVLFLCLIIPLRSICGGYHADKSFTCFCLSMLIYILSVLISEVIPFGTLSALCTFMLLALAVGIMTPVESTNKKMAIKAKEKQRKSYLPLISSIAALLTALLFAELRQYYSLIITTLFFTFIGQVAGSLKNKLKTI